MRHLTPSPNLYARKSEYWTNTPENFGNTDNKIRHYTNVVRDIGDAFTAADDSASGLRITANRSGIYLATVGDVRSDGNGVFGLSVNSTQLTTTIESITSTHRLGSIRAVSSLHKSVLGIQLWLNKGDVVRQHSDGTLTGDDTLSFFRLIHVPLQLATRA